MKDFTPGPWHLESQVNYMGWRIWAKEKTWVCAAPHRYNGYNGSGPNLTTVEDQANARLISSAPELYDALNEAMKLLPEGSKAFNLAVKILKQADGTN